MSNAKFHCRVEDGVDIYRPYWSMKLPDYPLYLSTEDNDDRVILDRRGVLYHSDDTTTNITIPDLARNNGTHFWCLVFNGGRTEFGEKITINVIGRPIAMNDISIIILLTKLEELI